MDIRIIEGRQARDFLHGLGVSENGTASVYRLRIALDGDYVKIKVNEDCWSPPFGGREGDIRGTIRTY